MLERGEPPAPDEPVRVASEGGRVTIDTGPMRMVLRTQFSAGAPSDPFAQCLVGDGDGRRNVFRGRPGPFLYMTDQHGTAYNSYAAAPPPAVTVEEAGPLRACVCIRGCHASKRGVR